MSKSSRLFAAASAAALTTLALGAAAQGAPPPRMVGGSAPSRADSGTAYISITHAKGSLQLAAGGLTDKLLGTGAVTYEINLKPGATGTLKIDAKKVVFYTSTGSLVGSATATLTITATSEKVTNGKLTLKRGFGSLAGDDLVANFSGTGAVNTDKDGDTDGNYTLNQVTIHYKGKAIA